MSGLDEFTIEITDSTLMSLMSGKSVLIVKLKGVAVSLHLAEDARKILVAVLERAMATYIADGTLGKISEGLLRGALKIEGGELVPTDKARGGEASVDPADPKGGKNPDKLPN